MPGSFFNRVFKRQSVKRKGTRTRSSQLFGFNLLTPPATGDPGTNNSSFPIDIIALHGITGDAFETFTAPNGILWLRDFLPQDIPGARVFSYGYNASVFFTKSAGDIDSFARNLLEGLKQQRIGGENQNRPIFFVCHSMGGLVVKRALIIAALNSALYSNIYDQCYGIAFLSTPHRGSTSTPFPKMLAQITNVAFPVLSRFIGRSRADLIRMLEKDAPALEQLSLDFSGSLSKIKIASFVESLVTPPASERIVDYHTGFIGSPGEHRIGMEGCDHRSVCRFQERDNNYKLVLGILKTWAEDFVSQSQNQSFQTAGFNNVLLSSSTDARHYQPSSARKPDPTAANNRKFIEMLESIHESEPSSHLIAVREPHHGTIEWLQDHPAISDIGVAERNRLVLITGMPGSGKSVIAASLFNRLHNNQKNDSATMGAFYACNGTDASRHNAKNILSSLLAQLLRAADKSATATPDLIVRVGEQIKVPSQANPGVGLEMDTMATMVLKLSQLSAGSRILIVVDALDECDSGTDREKFIQFLTKLIQSEGLAAIVTVIVLCRPYWDMNFDELGSARDARFHIDLDEAAEIQTGIRLFTAAMVKDFVKKRGGYASLEELMIEKIASRALGPNGGMYLMVELLINMLTRANKSTLKATLATIESLPSTLQEIYHRIWQDIAPHERQYARSMMTWILTMFAPVRVATLAVALGYEAVLLRYGDDGVQLSRAAVDEERPNDLSGDLRRLLGPLVRISKLYGAEVVTVTHQTVKEYFDTSKGKHTEGEPVQSPSLVEDFNIHVAKVCLVSLMMSRSDLVELDRDTIDGGKAPSQVVSLRRSDASIRSAATFCSDPSISGGAIWKQFHEYAKTRCIKHRGAASWIGESQEKIQEFDVLFLRTVRGASVWLKRANMSYMKQLQRAEAATAGRGSWSWSSSEKSSSSSGSLLSFRTDLST